MDPAQGNDMWITPYTPQYSSSSMSTPLGHNRMPQQLLFSPPVTPQVGRYTGFSFVETETPESVENLANTIDLRVFATVAFCVGPNEENLAARHLFTANLAGWALKSLHSLHRPSEDLPFAFASEALLPPAPPRRFRIERNAGSLLANTPPRGIRRALATLFQQLLRDEIVVLRVLTPPASRSPPPGPNAGDSTAWA
ncbi:hypothetical protein K438DRAFT_1986779 [Mycena galopus ATCC 62051]|nr:hypothetical protein K438DRAFT_1986779 [Mycena galopus ATCC 62051]